METVGMYGDSIMNPVGMFVHVTRLKVLLLNGFQQEDTMNKLKFGKNAEVQEQQDSN